MRKFRLLTQEGYYGLNKGEVYPENYQSKDGGLSVGELVRIYKSEWEEVFSDEQPEKLPLHKDTDLGYFSGVILAAFTSSPNHNNIRFDTLVERSIELAKGLIAQLDKERENK
jgi:hypothetical protein